MNENNYNTCMISKSPFDLPIHDCPWRNQPSL